MRGVVTTPGGGEPIFGGYPTRVDGLSNSHVDLLGKSGYLQGVDVEIHEAFSRFSDQVGSFQPFPALLRRSR